MKQGENLENLFNEANVINCTGENDFITPAEWDKAFKDFEDIEVPNLDFESFEDIEFEPIDPQTFDF